MSFNDIIFAIPIATIFNVFVYKISDIMYKDYQCKERYQKSATTLFVAGIIGIIIAQTVFNKKNKLNNRAVRFGLLGGSCLIIFYSVIKNWDLLDDVTKLIIFGILFSIIIAWSYFVLKGRKKPLHSNSSKQAQIINDSQNHSKNTKQELNKEKKKIKPKNIEFKYELLTNNAIDTEEDF